MSLLTDVQTAANSFIAKVADLVTQAGYLISVITGPAGGPGSLVNVGPRTLKTLARVLQEVGASNAFTPMGVWNSGTTYAALDGVSRNGVAYVSMADSNLNNDPATQPTWWMQLIQLNSPLNIVETSTGTFGPNQIQNIIDYTDTVVAPLDSLFLAQFTLEAGWGGTKRANRGGIFINGSPAGGSASYDVVAMDAPVVANAAMTASPPGGIFGFNPYVQINAGATGYSSAVGAEFDMSVSATATVPLRFGCLVTSQAISGLDAGSKGTVADAAFALSAAPPSTAPWGTGFYIVGGSMDGDSTILATGALTAGNGIDLRNVTFTGLFAFATNGFLIDKDGSVQGSSITLVGFARIPGGVITAPLTVGTLPAAGNAGRRMMVIDATVTTFASIVAGGGSNKVPVYDDGINWRIG